MAMTVVAAPCCQLSYILYRHCDLMVLKIVIPHECHKKKLKIKKIFLNTVIVKTWS